MTKQKDPQSMLQDSVVKISGIEPLTMSNYYMARVQHDLNLCS